MLREKVLSPDVAIFGISRDKAEVCRGKPITAMINKHIIMNKLNKQSSSQPHHRN